MLLFPQTSPHINVSLCKDMSEKITLFQPCSGSAGDERYTFKPIHNCRGKCHEATNNLYEQLRGARLVIVISSRAIASRTLCQAAFVEMSEGHKQHADMAYAIETVVGKPFPFRCLQLSSLIKNLPRTMRYVESADKL